MVVACTPRQSQVLTPEAQIDYTYIVRDPVSSEILFSGEMKGQTFTPATVEVFELLSGAKKDETRTMTARDPLHQHDPARVQKLPTLILNEMGLQEEETATLMIDNQNYTLVDLISEEGVEKAVLDPNPVHTFQTMDWEFTLTQIK